MPGNYYTTPKLVILYLTASLAIIAAAVAATVRGYAREISSTYRSKSIHVLAFPYIQYTHWDPHAIEQILGTAEIRRCLCTIAMVLALVRTRLSVV